MLFPLFQSLFHDSGSAILHEPFKPSPARSLSNVCRRWLQVLLVALAPCFAWPAEIAVFVPPGASPTEQLARQDLTNYLKQLYPRDRFGFCDRLPETGRGIVVGCATNPAVSRLLGVETPLAAESFLVTSRRDGERELGLIVGADPRGVLYGVYALLEKLGCGFYLSYETRPPPSAEPLSFHGWQASDRPLVRDRLVFEWHNFLSGCSTWNLQQWQSWICQAQKIGYNAIMVHAYGNNPMASFTFNGQTKPVGYLSTTVKGRDWSTMHVNDVRRLWGGTVFKRPVFGADAALVPESRRATAARNLMGHVFAYAAKRAMEVYFADDVDTQSANPQKVIETLPPSARFRTGTGKVWLANPDTPEGYRYYRAQVAALFEAYPQIDCLVVWFRNGRTPWMDLKLSEMPLSWREEYRDDVAQAPGLAKLWHAPQIFALGKVVRAFDRALQELGLGQVQLAAGTWRFDFLAPCDRWFPPDVKLIGLDYNILNGHLQLGEASSRRVIRQVAAHRAVIPVIWAQHDDGNYFGRPYTPFSRFYSKLADANVSGFGIIHWLTRPLDLYFVSHVKQVWQSTKNQTLRTTCDEMAGKTFGPSARLSMGAYLERWVTEAPKFGRETSDSFIARPLTNVAEVIAGCRERLKLIEAVDARKLTGSQCVRLDYFKGLEGFIIAFYQAQEAFQTAQARLKAGDLAGARQVIAACQPGPVIEQFSRFTSLGGITRGEQGLLISLNLRWLPHIVSCRQALGLEPVRLNFGPTSHDPLAQSPGKFTFDVTDQHEFWSRWGQAETGAPAWTLPADARVAAVEGLTRDSKEICRNGIESDHSLRLSLGPILTRNARSRSKAARLVPGPYCLHLLFVEPRPTFSQHRIFDVSVGPDSAFQAFRFDPSKARFRVARGSHLLHDRIDLSRVRGQPVQVIERRYRVTVGSSGRLEVSLTPVRGKALICGVVLEPLIAGTKATPAGHAAGGLAPHGSIWRKPLPARAR